MDLYRIIDTLLEERNRLDRLIRSLEAMGPPRPANRQKKKAELRGKPARRAMDPVGRSEVSERMKRYWAERRAAAPPPEG
ncbi:MAG: hypothetical protein QOJ99_4329 [Bryobacterales bacterium]|jgi:hypothetical protein|nr:hypothetical protein [Bryobacterales bacterium]